MSLKYSYVYVSKALYLFAFGQTVKMASCFIL